MAVLFNAVNDTLNGTLADVTPPERAYKRKGTCESRYGSWSCTLPVHPVYIPHIAGTGSEVAAIWNDAESGE